MSNNFKSIFSQVQKQNKFLKWVIGVQMVVILLALLTNVKPPIVIRETNNGAIIKENYGADSAVTELDVELFASTFINRFNLIDSFGVYENVPAALNMMGNSLRKHYKDKVIDKSMLDHIIEQKNRTTTTIKSVHSKKEGHIVPATITYERTVIGFESGDIMKMVIRGEAIFEIVPRSKRYPFGLKVIEYKEMQLS